jgi:putative methyltransferase (TIGR04325 family)
MLQAAMPPALWNAGKDLKRRLFLSSDHFEYAPDGWATPVPSPNEFWSSFLAQERSMYEALTARIRAGQSPLSVHSDERVKYLTYAFVLALAARDHQTLSVLDYGGNLGEYYWIGLFLVPGISLDYHCKELPGVAAAGLALNPTVTWHTDDSCLGRSYDMVMLCSSLECLPNWRETLRHAAGAADRYLFIPAVSTVNTVPSYVGRQRTGGRTHLLNLLNRSEITATVEGAGLQLQQEFAIGGHPMVANAPEQPARTGWLFERRR